MWNFLSYVSLHFSNVSNYVILLISNKEKQIFFKFWKKIFVWWMRLRKKRMTIESKVPCKTKFWVIPQINRRLGIWWGKKRAMGEANIFLLISHCILKVKVQYSNTKKTEIKCWERSLRQRPVLESWKALDHFMSINNICTPAGLANGRGIRACAGEQMAACWSRRQKPSRGHLPWVSSKGGEQDISGKNTTW